MNISLSRFHITEVQQVNKKHQVHGVIWHLFLNNQKKPHVYRFALMMIKCGVMMTSGVTELIVR